MASVVLYLQIHQPFRLRRYSVFDTDRHYFDDVQNAQVLGRVAERCYLPASQVLLETLKAHDGAARIGLSVTGVALEQFQLYAPQVIDALVALSQTGCVDFLDETYYHSLAFFYSREEFRAQVEAHRAMIKSLFDQQPRVFRNTELIYNNDLAQFVGHMGYDGILAEGADEVLGDRAPTHVYEPPHCNNRVLLKNYRLSDDISLRFSRTDWPQWPLTAEKFSQFVNQINGHGELCNLFLDFETFGEHQSAQTGILEFLRHLPAAVLAHPGNDFLSPAQAIDRYPSAGVLDVPQPISWADPEHNLTNWVGNAMQLNALHELFKLEGPLKDHGDTDLLSDWRKLTTSDHFYYMCTKYWSNGSRHNRYFSPYESPYDSYINFMNVLDNIQSRVKE